MLKGYGAYYIPNGYGAYYVQKAQQEPVIGLGEISSPGAALYRHLSRQYSVPMAGFGTVTTPPTAPTQPQPGKVSPGGGAALGGVALGVIAVVIIVAVAINYQIGKAMAPTKAKGSKWGWINGLGGTVFPPVTLGMAIYKNYFTD